MVSNSVLSPSTSSFLKLAERRLIVDKSSAIQDFLGEHWPVHVLLRPRRSGKTTLLRMFQAFFQRGNPADLQERKQLFLDNNLAITNDMECMEQFGVHPVLYVDFSIVGDSFEKLEVEFRSLVQSVALDLEKRGLLTNLDELHERDRIFLNHVLDGTLPAPEWRALYLLTDILHTIHKRRVIVLIDEYDTPAAHSTRCGYFNQANEFFRKIFQPLLKDNEHLGGALVVGILRVAKAGWFSGANNLGIFLLGDADGYSTACMFTEAETQLLYEEQKRRYPTIPFTFADLREWYNGYTSGDGQRLYNPWSIAMALQRKKLDRYWVESGYDKVLLERFHIFLKNDHKFRKQIERLLIDEPVSIELDHGMTHSIPHMSRRQLWTLLYSAGYLTRRVGNTGRLHDVMGGDPGNSSGTDSPDDGDSDGGENSDPSAGDLRGYLSVRLPNREIQSIFRQWLRDHLMDLVNHSGKEAACRNMFRDMVSGSMASFAKEFMKMIWTKVPSPFLGTKEYVYQAFLYGFFTVVCELASSESHSGEWEISAEGSSGIGRFDCSMHSSSEGVIHEYKRIAMEKMDKRSGYGDSQCKRLTKEAEEGLKQIEVKGYRARLPDAVTNLREYGMAFLGPYCAIVGRSLERAPGGQWKYTQSYRVERNERHRDKLYTASA